MNGPEDGTSRPGERPLTNPESFPASTLPRYHPSRVRLLARRRSHIVDAAIRWEETYCAVQAARVELEIGTPERYRVFRARAEAKKSLLYHVREFLKEDV